VNKPLVFCVLRFLKIILSPFIQAGEPEYAWVSRHTWQSWRERYKKNAERLDKTIAVIVEQKRPQPGEKGQYGYVRQAEETQKRSRKRKIHTVEEVPQTDQPVHTVIVAGPSHVHAPMVPPEMNIPTLGPSVTTLHESTRMGNPFSVVIAPSSTAIPMEDPIRDSPAEEELEDDETDWAVRIGNAPPPAWSKMSSPDEENFAIRKKRARKKLLFFYSVNPNRLISLLHSEPTTSTSDMHGEQVGHEKPSLPPTDLLTIATLHVIDIGMRDIAKEFRFTIEEVKEYYDKCADMLKTRSRFQRMREELSARFPVDPQ
jgi:hypothetical protein